MEKDCLTCVDGESMRGECDNRCNPGHVEKTNWRPKDAPRAFQVGDRVRHEKYGDGTVTDIHRQGDASDPYGVRFDKKCGGHNLGLGGNSCECGYGYYCEPKKLKLIKEATMDKSIIRKLFDRAISTRTASDEAHGAYVGVLKGALSGKVTKEEDILSAKRDMLFAVMEGLPLSPADCYYCLARDNRVVTSCHICPYGKKRGNCRDSDSDYQKIIRAKDALIAALRNYHHDGDTYGDQPLAVGDVVVFKEGSCKYRIARTGEEIIVKGSRFDSVLIPEEGMVVFANRADLQRA